MVRKKIFFNFESFMSGSWVSKGPRGSSPNAFFAMSSHISMSPSQAWFDRDLATPEWHLFAIPFEAFAPEVFIFAGAVGCILALSSYNAGFDPTQLGSP